MEGYFKIETKLGNVYVKPTDANHIFVGANHNCLSKHIPEGENRHPGLVVNNVEMGVSAHFYRWADGTFHIGQEKDGVNIALYHGLYGSRNDKTGYNESKISDAAMKKISAVLTPLVNEWVLNNPVAMHGASVEDLEKKLNNAEEEFKNKRVEYRDAEAKMNRLRDELSRAKGGK